jgi:alkylhydroperoxidase/carboxymuconolactone decarboxylase family protein YurZ
MKARIPKSVERFGRSYAKVWKNFKQLGEACHGAGPLPERTRRLVKVGIAAAAQSEGAVHSAVRNARAAGVSPTEIRHAILLSVTTIGFPRAMAALTWAEDVLRKK